LQTSKQIVGQINKPVIDHYYISVSHNYFDLDCVS